MTSVQSDEARMLRESAAALVASRFPIEQVRRIAEGPDRLATEAHGSLAAQGWLGILLPEEHGGLGLGVTGLGIVLEELGRGLVPGPFWSAATLGVPIVAGSPNAAIRDRWLDDLAGGASRVTLALLESASLPEPERLTVVAEPAGPARWILQGRKRFVPDLVGADAIAVVAGDRGRARVFLIEPTASGVRIEGHRTTDATSRYGTLDLDRVEVTEAELLGDWSLVEPALRCGNVGIAAMAVAAAEAVFNQAVAYVKHRVQFGVPVGTFQAVQHPLANLFGEIESARSAYLYAAWAVDHEHPGAGPAVALARIAATEAYRLACTTSLQAHGGIAFTWEYDLHLHLKRALHLLNLLGLPGDYEELIAREVLRI